MASKLRLKRVRDGEYESVDGRVKIVNQRHADGSRHDWNLFLDGRCDDSTPTLKMAKEWAQEYLDGDEARRLEDAHEAEMMKN